MFKIFVKYPLLKTMFKIAIVICLTSLLLKALRKMVHKHTDKNGISIHMRFFYNLIKAMIVLIAFATIGSEFEGFSQAVTTIMASSGILALGASLAAQESMTNIIDGLFISIFKPYNIGDRVTLPEKNNLTGTITEMNLRHTVITTFSNTSYIIPNAQMSTAVIENSNFNNKSYSYPVDVTISYDSDMTKAMAIIQKSIIEHPDFIDTRPEDVKATGAPAVVVSLREFAQNGIALRAMVTVEDVSKSFRACSDIRIKIKEAFDREGILLPYTTISVVRKPDIRTFSEPIDLDAEAWEDK